MFHRRVADWGPIGRRVSAARGALACRRIVLGAVVAMLALGGLLVWRRLAGALDRDLDPWQLLGVAGASAAIVFVARRTWQRLTGDSEEWAPRDLGGDPAEVDWRPQFVGWGSSLALLLLAVGCCYPGDRNIEWLTWFPLVIGDQFWRQSFFDAVAPYIGESLGSTTPAEDSLARQPAGGEQIVQQLFRIREADGREAIYGSVLADFQQGQRFATLHVGFCPPLGHLPKVEAGPWDFPLAQVKVTQTLAHGVRLDVRLSEAADEPCTVQIDLAARPADVAEDRQAG